MVRFHVLLGGHWGGSRPGGAQPHGQGRVAVRVAAVPHVVRGGADADASHPGLRFLLHTGVAVARGFAAGPERGRRHRLGRRPVPIDDCGGGRGAGVVPG